MTKYVARVELHENATAAEYEELDLRMEGAGYSRVIVGKDLRRYSLPKGTFEGYSASKAPVVRDQVFQIAFSVLSQNAPLPSVIIFNGSGCSFILDPCEFISTLAVA